jgi:hypothetical protein
VKQLKKNETYLKEIEEIDFIRTLSIDSNESKNSNKSLLVTVTFVPTTTTTTTTTDSIINNKKTMIRNVDRNVEEILQKSEARQHDIIMDNAINKQIIKNAEELLQKSEARQKEVQSVLKNMEKEFAVRIRDINKPNSNSQLSEFKFKDKKLNMNDKSFCTPLRYVKEKDKLNMSIDHTTDSPISIMDGIHTPDGGVGGVQVIPNTSPNTPLDIDGSQSLFKSVGDNGYEVLPRLKKLKKPITINPMPIDNM